ncbi:DEAD/DEAH box helicase, partial [Cellulomonas rhizosphaerae]
SRALEDKHSDSVRVGRLQAGMWAELEDLGIVVAQAAQWQEAVAQVRALEEPLPDTPVPTSVRAELRPYQQSGFAWLARLADAGLGGILADDMGLGKTLQVLSLAAHLRAAGRPPLLVVAPTSVVGAWAGEAATFLPDLRVATVDRTAARRGHALAEAVAGADVVVTSYALFRIEHDEYDAQEWSALVLDEAQMVKNHDSRAYACARTLRAPVKFAVTGTPLENTVMELWALLGIVAPGLFPSQKRFVEHFRLPIERAGDSERLAQLRRLIRPVVLRRTKESVASELPPRVETVVDVELAPKHRSVYDRQLQRERQKVLGLLADFDGNRFEIFRSLTLLRRLALDPSLVDDAHAGVPASKLDVLESMLAEIVADGHRVLVFSQFTGVLDRVRSRLTERGTAFAYLDGRTRGRPAVIESFRSGSAPVFLISLKAGGFGLTLTEADYVVVLDPWWNPAVEAQAVDRAHRIGQTRTVMVYRLVAKGTIEEKVMALKAEKAALFDSVMGGGELSDSRMGADDVRALLGV